MSTRSARLAGWLARTLLAAGLLLVAAGAGLWWWAGQEGSLQWVLQRAARSGALHSEGVQGSLRGGWHIARLAWQGDGLRVEAEDIRLEWQPLALLEKTLRLDQVQVKRVSIIDQRPRTGEPLQPPASLRLPWRVVVDDLRVAQLDYQGPVQLEASGLVAQYGFDGLRHRLELQSLQMAGGNYHGSASVLALPPLTLDAQLAGSFEAAVPGAGQVPLAFTLQASGPAAAIDVQGRLRVARASGQDPQELPQANLNARITPFAAMPLPHGAADFRQLDLGLFWPAAPHTLLSGHVEVVPAGSSRWSLRADVRNALAGPWDAQKLPLTHLRGSGEWRDGTALVQSLSAELAGGRIQGSGAWAGAGWRFEGQVDQVDPAQLHGSLASLPLSGPVKLEGEAGAVDFDVALQAPRAPARARRSRSQPEGLQAALGALQVRELLARGRWSGDTVALSRLKLDTSDAALQGKLELQLAAQAGNGELLLRAPGLQVRATGRLGADHGQGSAQLVAADLARAQRWLARFPWLTRYLQDLALQGRAQAQLAWQGGWRDPTVQAELSAESLGWQARTSGSPTPPWLLRQASARVQGRLRDAALQVDVQAAQGQRELTLDAAGRVGGRLGAAPRWNGRLASLTVQWMDPALAAGPWQLQLRDPVAWQLAGGSFELGAGEAVLRAPALRRAPPSEALLAWAPVRRQGGALSTSGRISGLPQAWLELLGGAQLAGAGFSGDMVFDAQWHAQLGDTLRVEASLARMRGDVEVLAEGVDGAAARVQAGVRAARLVLRSDGEQLLLSLLWDSERAGHAEGELRTRLQRSAAGGWRWAQDAPVSGRVRASLPRIGVWSLLAPPGWRLRGALDADITVAGTRAQPTLSGPVRADALALRSVVDGIELRDGRLRARLEGQRLVVDEFLLHGSEEGGGGGTLLAWGEGRWTPQGASFEAQAQLTQLRASLRSDRQLTVSGPVSARMDASGTSVTGKLVVDRARIQIPDDTPPRLGDDVVVRNGVGGVGGVAGLAGAAPGGDSLPAKLPRTGRRKLELTIAFDLGPDFRVSGRGVDTRLAGTLEIRATVAGGPQIFGLVRTVGGTYQAYGQRMEIKRGELRFTGAPANPALDVLALRPNIGQDIGVQITGRAQSPHVALYSGAGLSDAETLSWLVLGRSSSGGGAETALLQRAATALLAGRGGTGKGLAGSLGLDDLSVRPDSTSGAVVRVGKRFADNFYAAYERSLSGAMGTLFVFYDISQRLTLRLESGERTGLDLIFTFSFDRARK